MNLSTQLRSIGSREWYAAFKRFSFGFNFEESPEEPLEVARAHHYGWRRGVIALKNDHVPPRAPSGFEGTVKRAFEHGAVAGRKSAQEYLDKTGKNRKALR